MAKAKLKPLEKSLSQVEAETEHPTQKRAVRAPYQAFTTPIPETNNFTGVARSVQCFWKNGHDNFRIVSLYIENGKVVKSVYSDPFATFELGDKLNLMNDKATISLSMCWEELKALQK